MDWRDTKSSRCLKFELYERFIGSILSFNVIGICFFKVPLQEVGKSPHYRELYTSILIKTGMIIIVGNATKTKYLYFSQNFTLFFHLQIELICE